MSDGLKKADGLRWQKNHISPSKLDLWSRCSAAFWFRYVLGIKKPGRVWLPQGTAVHAGVEHLLNDLAAGITRDKEYYELMAEMAWDEQIARSNGIVYGKKGGQMTKTQIDNAIEETKYWFNGFYTSLQDEGTIDGFDPRTVTETEVDAIRQVDWGPEGGPETYVRGYIDWVVDTSGPVAQLADLKTSNPNRRWGWSDSKADAMLQATAYGYMTGKPTDFDYIIIPKEDIFTAGGARKATPNPVTPYRARTTRHQLHYDAFINRLRAFVRDTDLHNDYQDFKPWPNQKPTNYGWCDQLCDYKEECQKHYGGK
jgi:hypothetical protein